MIDYLDMQPTSSGVQDAIALYLSDFTRQHTDIKEVSSLHLATQRLVIEKLLQALLHRGLFSMTQYILEEFQARITVNHDNYSSLLHDIDTYMLQISQSIQDGHQKLGVWYGNCGQPWIQQLIYTAQLREPRRQLQLILNEFDDTKTEAYWNQIESEDKSIIIS